MRDEKCINQCVTLHPEFITVLGRKLRSLGHTPEQVQKDSRAREGQVAAPVTGGPASRRSLAQQKRLEVVNTQTHRAAAKHLADPVLKYWIPDKYVIVKDFSVDIMAKGILEVCEPHVLSQANLRHARTVRKDAMSKETIWIIVEWVTGLPPGFELKGTLRYWPYFRSVVFWRSVVRGRRGSRVSMPPKFPEEGLLSMTLDSEQVIAMQRFTRVKVPVKITALPRFSDASSLVIALSHSESMACIKSTEDVASVGVSLCAYYQSHIVDETIMMPVVPRPALAGPLARGCCPRRMVACPWRMARAKKHILLQWLSTLRRLPRLRFARSRQTLKTRRTRMRRAQWRWHWLMQTQLRLLNMRRPTAVRRLQHRLQDSVGSVGFRHAGVGLLDMGACSAGVRTPIFVLSCVGKAFDRPHVELDLTRR